MTSHKLRAKRMMLPWQPEHLGDKTGEETQVTVTLPKGKVSATIVAQRDMERRLLVQGWWKGRTRSKELWQMKWEKEPG
jgi:hypothetical protein